NHDLIVATRLDSELAQELLKALPGASYFEQARMFVWGDLPDIKDDGATVAIVTAGTADLPVAEEAAMFLAASGIATQRFFDVGVAGIHRLFDKLPDLQKCDVTIVVAGMDGALPSVVAGLLPGPVIAVPTSVGYGASFQGIAALLTMLNSCASGITVVNIDNGFGAAMAAARILDG